MSHRTPPAELKFIGSKNLKRALERGPAPKLAKRKDVEKMYAEISERRAELLAIVKREGAIIIREKFSARGELYQQKVAHPALNVIARCEHQLTALAKLLAGTDAEEENDSHQTVDNFFKAAGIN